MKNTMKNIGRGVKNAAPGILTGFGLICMGVSVWRAIKDTDKYRQEKFKMDEAAEQMEEEPSKIQKVTTVVACYWPTIVIFGAGAGCIIGAQVLQNNKVASLMALAAATQLDRNKLMEAAKETVGEENVDKLFNKYAEKKVEDEDDILVPDKPCTELADWPDFAMVPPANAPVLMKDSLSGQFFYNTYNEIESQTLEFNKMIAYGDFVEANDWIESIGCERADALEEVGWDERIGQIRTRLIGRVTEDGRPYAYVTYETTPSFNRFTR